MFPVERRLLLKFAPAALFGLVDSISFFASSSVENSGKMNWNQFIDKLGALAERRSRSGQPSLQFVTTVGELGVHLDYTDPSLAGAYALIKKRQAVRRTPLFLAQVHREATFEILLLSLDAAHSIPLHDHPNRSVISICVTGQARISKYDLFRSGDSPALKLHSRSVVGPSQADTLTETLGNIHTISAIQKTQLIDVLSPPAPNTGGFHYYNAEPDSNDRTILRVKSIS